MKRFQALPTGVKEIVTIDAFSKDSSSVYVYYIMEDGRILKPCGEDAASSGKQRLEDWYFERKKAHDLLNRVLQNEVNDKRIRAEINALDNDEIPNIEKTKKEAIRILDESQSLRVERKKALLEVMEFIEGTVADLESLFPSEKASSENVKDVLSSIFKKE